MKLTQSEFRAFLINFIEYWGRFNTPAAKTYRMIGESVLITVYGELLDPDQEKFLRSHKQIPNRYMDWHEDNVVAYLDMAIDTWKNSSTMGQERQDKIEAFQAIRSSLIDEIRTT